MAAQHWVGNNPPWEDGAHFLNLEPGPLFIQQAASPMWKFLPRSPPAPKPLRQDLEGRICGPRLFFHEPKPKPWTCCRVLNWELEQYKCHKVEWNWENWLSTYTIFMAIVLQTQAWRTSVLVKYMDIIHHTYNSFAGPAWLSI